MFDYISTAVDILIAFIGMVIALLQMRNDKREKRKEQRLKEEREKRKNIIEDLVAKTSVIVEPNYIITVFYDGIRSKMGNELVKFIVDTVPEIIKSEDKFRAVISEIFKKMLRYESEFSLSYGYARYINCFRETVLNNDIQDVDKKYVSLIEYIEMHGANPEPKHLEVLVNSILGAVNKINESHKELLPFCQELQIKFGEE